MPAWIFPIWIIMYVWQGVWILYGLWLIIMEQRVGWLYNKPSLTPPSTYLASAVGFAAILGWLVLFDHSGYDNYAPLCLLGSCAFSFLALGRSLAKSVRYCTMVKVNCPGDVILSRILVHNGLAFMASWTMILMLYQLAHLLCRGRYVTEMYAGFIFLGVLLGYEIILFTADVFLARNITGGLLSPYILVALTFTQSVLINFSTANHMFMVAIVMLGFSVLLFLTKLIVDIQRVSIGGSEKY